MLSQPVHFLLNVFIRGYRRDAPHHDRWNHVNVRRVLGAAIRGASLIRRFIGRIAIQPLAELESLLRRQFAYRFDNLVKCEQRHKNISAEILAQPLQTRGVRGGHPSGGNAEDVNGQLYIMKRPPKGQGPSAAQQRIRAECPLNSEMELESELEDALGEAARGDQLLV